jgi:two-component system, LytTR family, response regulator
MAINVILVDDEQEACINLQNILRTYVNEPVNILGVAHNTKEAEQLVKELRPDALFLDIQMPNENSFQFLQRIAPINFEVVFVTAYDEYAIRAFKLNAVDYILKPISISELTVAVSKLKDRLKYRAVMGERRDIFSDLPNDLANRARSYRITLKNGTDLEIVEFKDIFFAEAQGSYTKFVFRKDTHVKEIVLSSSLSEYEELLPATLFYRIHKSYLINCAHVKKILKDEIGQVVINDSYTLPVSRRRYSPLLEFLKNNDYSYE